jgi:hypothetical protein
MKPYPFESLNHFTVPVATEKHLPYLVVNGKEGAACASRYSLVCRLRVAGI